MKHSYQGFISLAVNKTEDSWDWVAIKTNNEGKILDLFNPEKEMSMVNRLPLFAKWIGDVERYRIVSFGHEQFHSFFKDVENQHSARFPRFLIRMIKAQLWNIKSECMYRFHIKEDLSLKELLFLYEQQEQKHSLPLMAECMNVIQLTNRFLFDKQQTTKLMRKDKKLVIEQIYRNKTVDELLDSLLSVVSNIHIVKTQLGYQLNAVDLDLVIVGKCMDEILIQSLLSLHPLTKSNM